MAERPQISFVKLEMPRTGSVVVLADGQLNLGPIAAALDEAGGTRLKRAAAAQKYEGKLLKGITFLTPAGGDLDRAVFLGLGDSAKLSGEDWLKLGGTVPTLLAGEGTATVVLERPDGVAVTPEQAADVALGIALRSYAFDKYKTKKKNEDAKPRAVALAVADPRAATKAWAITSGIADGVMLARDLVNEPANILGPIEFADRLKELSALGLEVEVLDEAALAELKMGAILGVAQGSVRPARVVVMRWNGGRAKDKPVALVGKGVVFDTGGISIKPAAGMEDMKGDMGGAAAVAGTMHALASRKAKANVIGIVGIVENMPDANAQRPGDIVTSMSGQTIEVINTDAEGRLVLADVITYVQRTYQPSAIIDLATLTGAVIVALGNLHAGLFANDNDLAHSLIDAGRDTGEKLWRLPIGPDYDKLIDSKFADMKNIGGRNGGAIIGAVFIQRFVENDTPWAHLDIAGTAMSSPATEINQSWGSGFGVRLLDQFIRARYETKS